MKNIKKAKIILGITIATAFLATVTASLTWFDNRVNLNPSINGSSAAAYFAYGDGSKEHPYGIKTPRHLYNLAWLQYLGEFNKSSDPVCFELADNVNMTSNSNIGALPPIGNSKYPFTGVFNGNEKTISNLIVSDSFSDFKTTPYSVTSGNYTSDNILGMFGVIGDSKNDTNPDTSVSGFNLENPVIKSTGEKALAGIVAGYVNANVSSIGVIEPKIQLEYSLTSGTITNTTAPLTGSSLKEKNFTNISDYSVVGYCTDNYKSSVSSSVTEMTKTNIKTEMVPNAPGGSGSGLTDWGGSIDMKELYDRLQTMKSKSTPIQYTTNVEMNSDGSQKETKADVKINSWENESNGKYTDFKYPIYTADSSSGYKNYYFGFKEYSQTNTQNEKTSSIAFIDSPYGRDQNSIGLTGGADRYIIDGKTIDSSSLPTTGKKQKQLALFYEKKGSDNIYLKVVLNADSSTSMLTTNNPSEASIIQLEKATSDSGEETYSISTTISGKEYYLSGIKDSKNNITDVQFTTTANPVTWEYDTNATAFCLVENPIYYFTLDSDYSEWGLNAGGVSYNLYSGTTTSHVYFNNGKDGTDFTGATTDTGATEWFLENGYVYRIRVESNKENKAAYLTHDSTDGLKTAVSNSKSYTYFITNDDYVYIYYYDNKQLFYPIYDNGKWIESKIDLAKYTTEQIQDYLLNNNVTKFKRTLKSHHPFLYSGRDGVSQLTTDSQFTTPDTYIPLQEESEGIPSNSNTGYIVGGTDYYRDYYGDIRVSRYELNNSDYNINNSLGDGKKLNNVYTITTEGATKKATDEGIKFSKYSTSKEQLEESINGDYIYGLHFMKASVGKKRDQETYVTIPSARINEKEWIENYQVPDDCIDFTLKEDGYINFFAGTYYPSNNCFFSLYQIQRDGNSSITSINKIKKIYEEPTTYNSQYPLGDDKQYRLNPDPKQPKYKFAFNDTDIPTWSIQSKNTSGEWSNGTGLTQAGTLVFDSSKQLGEQQIDKEGKTFSSIDLKKNSVYYFEIPVTAGEYALGSVDELDGAYLMYLDLGTNSGLNADVTRTIISESMTITTNRYSSFMGVTFISAGNSGSSNTYCIVLKSGATGNILFDDKGVETNKTGTDASPSWVAVSFKKDNSVVTINGTEAEYTNPIKEKAETTIKRVTYIDVLANGTKNMVQVTSSTTKKNDETKTTTETTRTYYSIDEAGKLTVSNDRLYFADANGHDMEESALDKLPENAEYSTEKMLSFQLDTELFGTIHISFEASYVYNSDSKTYSIGGYNILITGNNLTEDTQVTITQIDSNTYTFTFNEESKKETITLTIPKSASSN